MMKSGDMLIPILALLRPILTSEQLDKIKIVATYSNVFITWRFACRNIPEMNLKIRGALKEFAKTQGRTLRIRFEKEHLY